MPRKNSMDRTAPGTYHVYNRGRDRRIVFRDDDDRHRFIAALKSELTKDPAWDTAERQLDLFAICLMNSHYHLVLRQAVAGLIARMMQSVIATYTRYFNRRYGTSGPLFDNPYRSQRQTGRKQFKWAIAYVHANHPSGPTYRFSSHNAYVDPDLCPPWLSARAALAVFGGRGAYLDFMEKHSQRAQLNELFF